MDKLEQVETAIARCGELWETFVDADDDTPEENKAQWDYEAQASQLFDLLKDGVLLAELRERRADGARLDWLEAHGNALDSSGYGADDMWWTLLYNDGNKQEGGSPRAAIDAAMKGVGR
jgi:hypothetical protein